MNLKELQRLQTVFDKAHSSRKEFFVPITESERDELQFLIICLAGEVGELANISKKIQRGDFTIQDVRGDLEEETADVFIYLLKLSSQLGFDLEEAFLKKLQANEQRFRDFTK